METICDFSLPVNLNNGIDPDPKLADWEYSRMVCETAESLETAILPEVITDGENNFNVYPSFSYAEIVIIFFLICFFAFRIFGAIWSFVHTTIIRQKWLR